MADVNKVARNVLKMIDQGAPEEDIDAYIKKEGYTPDQLKQNRAFVRPSPTEGMGELEKFRAGWGKNVADTALGVQQALTEAAAQPGRLIPGQPFGPMTTKYYDKAQELRKEQDLRAARDKPLMKEPAATAGYFASGFLPQMAMGNALRGTKVGANLFLPENILQAGGQGVLSGLMQPVGTNDSRAENALASGAFASGGYGVARALSGFPTSDEAKLLMREGVVPTPGQAAPKTKLGDFVRKAEERAGTALFLGEPISGARERAQNELVSAGMKRAGGTGAIGQEAIGDLQDKIGAALDTVGPRLGKLSTDTKIYSDLGKIGLDDDLAKRVVGGRSMPSILGGGKYGGAERQGDISGEELMKMRSSWMQKLRDLAPIVTEEAQDKKRNLRKGLEAVDDFIERVASPEIAKDYAGLRGLYRNLVVMESAGAKAAGRVANPGVPTPSMLMQAVKENARSSGTLPRKALAAGKANMQNLATAGMSLGNTIPNSGTAERLGMAALLGGGLAGAYMQNPAVTLGLT